MKLSDCTTLDALILQLAAEGFSKIEDRRPTQEEVASHAVGLYAYIESSFPEHPGLIRQVDIWPQQIKDRGDAGFSASINEQRQITGWFSWESYAGQTKQLDPDSELIQVFRAIDNWLED
jgi:hypothetical protein